MLPPNSRPSHVPPSQVLNQPPAFDSKLAERFYVEAKEFDSAAPEQDSLYLWGCLIKSWATGTNHFPGQAPDAPFPSPPATGDELHDLLISLGIEHDMPLKRFTTVVYSQTTEDTLAIRLPAKDAVLKKENEIATGTGSYDLPGFYPAFFGPLTPPAADRDTSMYVHTLRVGEYSMNNCA